MIQWTRVHVAEMCGLCSSIISPGQPALVIVMNQLRNQKRHRFRCVDCVGPAPPDLPRVVELKEPEREPLRPLKTMASKFTREKLAETDWTSRLLGERNS